jgi:hypothetical protein
LSKHECAGCSRSIMRPMGFLLRRIPPTGEWKPRALARRASFSGWAKIRTRVTRPSLFRNKGDYGVGLASSRGCSGNGLSYVQESDKALPRKRRGSDTFRQTQGVILSNVEGWHPLTGSGCHPELLSKDANRRMETPGFSPESFIHAFTNTLTPFYASVKLLIDRI